MDEVNGDQVEGRDPQFEAQYEAARAALATPATPAAPVADPPAEPGEGTPEPEAPPPETIESLTAKLAERDAALAAKEKVLSGKDRHALRMQEERDAALADAKAIRDEADRSAQRARLVAAKEDPELADKLVADELAALDAPPPGETPEAKEARLVREANIATHAQHRQRLGITDAEEAVAKEAARQVAVERARDNGDPNADAVQPHFTDVMAAEAEVAAHRAASGATAELAAKEEELRLANEELEALRAGDAGARIRTAGGPEERVPAGGSRAALTYDQLMAMEPDDYAKVPAAERSKIFATAPSQRG